MSAALPTNSNISQQSLPQHYPHSLPIQTDHFSQSSDQNSTNSKFLREPQNFPASDTHNPFPPGRPGVGRPDQKPHVPEFTNESSATQTGVKCRFSGSLSESCRRMFKSLKIRTESALTGLYSPEMVQCRTCGFRLENTDELQKHLDAHFREGKRRGPQRFAFLHFRDFYQPGPDWRRDRPLNEIPLGLFDFQTPAIEKPVKNVASDPTQKECQICFEKFDEFFDDESGQWMFRGALSVQIDDRGCIVHQACHESEVAEKPRRLAGVHRPRVPAQNDDFGSMQTGLSGDLQSMQTGLSVDLESMQTEMAVAPVTPKFSSVSTNSKNHPRETISLLDTPDSFSSKRSSSSPRVSRNKSSAALPVAKRQKLEDPSPDKSEASDPEWVRAIE
eukprot:1122_1